MLRLKRIVMNLLIFISLSLTYFMLLVCIAYISVDDIEFSINGTGIEFEGLTYGDIKQFDIQQNTVFIVTDGEEQVDITKCDCGDDDIIKSLTVVVTNTTSVCDFSVYGIKVGGSSDVVVDNMPAETSHTVDESTNVQISKYVDKNNNVLIVGTDIELNIVSYVTIRTGKQPTIGKIREKVLNEKDKSN